MLLLQLVHFTRTYHAMASASMCSALTALMLNGLLGQPYQTSLGRMRVLRDEEKGDSGTQKHSFHFGTLDPRNAGIMMYFQLLENDVSARFGYVQFTVTFNGMDGSVRKRVITKRLLFTSSRQSFLRSIDVNVTSVGIAKKAILMAQKLGQKWALEELETVVFNMVYFFAKEHRHAAKKTLKTEGDSARRAAGCACHAISIIARSLLGAHPAT